MLQELLRIDLVTQRPYRTYLSYMFGKLMINYDVQFPPPYRPHIITSLLCGQIAFAYLLHIKYFYLLNTLPAHCFEVYNNTVLVENEFYLPKALLIEATDVPILDGVTVLDTMEDIDIKGEPTQSSDLNVYLIYTAITDEQWLVKYMY